LIRRVGLQIPFDGLKILKGDMDYYYDSDPEIQQSIEKIAYWKTIIDTLSDIMEKYQMAPPDDWQYHQVEAILKVGVDE